MPQLIEIRPGLTEEHDVVPEDAADLLEALAIGDAERLRGLVSGEELMRWARGAARIPDGPLQDIWLSTETALEVGGEDCDGLSRVFRAGAELAEMDAAVLVVDEGGGDYHFLVEYLNPAGEKEIFDPRDLPIATGPEYGGVLDGLLAVVKAAGPAVAGAAMKALTGDVVGAGLGLAGAALEAVRGKAPASPAVKTTVRQTPVLTAPIQRAIPQLAEKWFYFRGGSGKTYRSRSGKKGSWELV